MMEKKIFLEKTGLEAEEKRKEKRYHPTKEEVQLTIAIETELFGYNEMEKGDHPHIGEKKEIPCRCKLPGQKTGRVPGMMRAVTKNKKAIGADQELYVPVCGPAYLAYCLRGKDIYQDAKEDPEYVKELADFCCEASIRLGDYYMEAGADGIMVMDPVVLNFSEDEFESLFEDAFCALSDYLKMKEKGVPVFSDEVFS
ncbi:MAG: uroporphyrinogen decarboxylase family protein [Lachnospiraceae bacterium]|nr:uroporphyrinogen decarboxylase family protein [Lachnospiraceae bacterium]